MKRSATLSPLRASALAGLLLLGATACVTRGTHQQVVDERDTLAQRVRRLETSYESLTSERVKLIDEMEDLRTEREDLQRNLVRLRRAEAELSENLRMREEQLASREAELSNLRSTYDGLVSDLESEVAAGQIQIEQLREGLRLNLTQDVLFDSGSAQLNAEGTAVLRKVAARVREVPHVVEVQGHTDNVPIRSTLSRRYPSNWELAAARASVVVRLMADEGVGSERLRAVSFGEFRPIASNETPEGRARNRRIEIRLSPVLAAAPEAPAPARPSQVPPPETDTAP